MARTKNRGYQQTLTPSEIADCIDKVVVDGGGKIVVKWSIDQNRIGAVGTNMENP